MIKTRKLSLKQNIVNLLLICWVIPVLIMTLLLATFVNRRTNEQIEANVVSSLSKATEIFDLQLYECETASKNASYYSDIREAYLDYVGGGLERDFTSAVNGFLRSEYKYNSVAKAALLYFPEPNRGFYTYNNSALGSYKDIEFYYSLANDVIKERADYIGTSTVLINVGNHCYMVRNLVLNNFETYATLSIEMNTASFLKGMESVWGYEDAIILKDDGFFMGSRGLLDESELVKIKQDLSKNETGFYHLKENSYVGISFKKYGEVFYAIVKLDSSQLYQKLYMTWLIFAIMVVLMIPLTIIIFKFFQSNVTKPMDTMLAAYNQVADQNYGYQINDLAKSYEFYYMQKSFNEMSLQIKEQFEKIYREEIALRDAQIMALQSQINPHFLNNTFEIINWEARLNGNIKVSRMIEALSVMMEATMNRRGNQLNSLAEEISYVDAYAYIISERLGEKFSYEKKIDESLMSFQVPKLIVQPIVENAVEHGLSETKNGNIVLSVFKQGDFICIEITNDGPLSEENKNKIEHLLRDEIDPDKEKSISLGIRNVHNRLRLIYGESSGLEITSLDDAYTVSTIRIFAGDNT